MQRITRIIVYGINYITTETTSVITLKSIHEYQEAMAELLLQRFLKIKISVLTMETQNHLIYLAKYPSYSAKISKESNRSYGTKFKHRPIIDIANITGG